MSGTEPIWKDIAQRCDGVYFRVSQGGDAKEYKTPYDKEISEKSKRLEETKVYYGDRSFHEKNRKKLEAVKDIYESAKPSAIAKRSSYNLSESGKENFLGQQELVDSVTGGKTKLEDIKEDELPESMQKMTVDERKKHLEKLHVEREQIVNDLRKLSEKRQAYIQDQVKKEKDKGENSLDMKLYKCIQSQAAEKSIEYTDALAY